MQRSVERNEDILIIGAGPAGLTAGLELVKKGFKVVIFEASNKIGGLSRTEEYKSYKFDIGGHRFFTKNKQIENFWKEVLGSDLLVCKRKSRILYEGKYYNYPLSFFNALRNLGILQSIKAFFSYIRFQMKPVSPEVSYADWVKNRFGKVLFETFFKTYTEKVWGIPVEEISKDWAVQRIKKLSLGNAVVDALFKNQRGKITTLTDRFYYPKYGPGQMWEEVAKKFQELGGKIEFGTKIVGIESKVKSKRLKGSRLLITSKRPEDTNIKEEFDHVISSMPLRSLIYSIKKAPKGVLEAANRLEYRDFITVLVIVDKKSVFDDNWIYIHDPEVKVSRIQNFKNWSPFMISDEGKTSLGLEYFFSEKEEFWNLSDEEILNISRSELVKLGICEIFEIEDGRVLRVKKAYPVYDQRYTENVELIKKYLKEIPNLHVIGRNGMHKYNNQDHSMATGLVVARNIIAGSRLQDPWLVNAEAEYIEEAVNSYERLVPEKVVNRKQITENGEQINR